MKKIIPILILSFLFLQCTDSKKQRTDCNTTVRINKTKICVPNIKGLSNVTNNIEYSEKIKQLEVVGNEILALYVKEPLNYESSSIYVNPQFKDDISESTYKEMSDKMGEYINKYNKSGFVNDYVKELEINNLRNIDFDKELLIDNYRLNNNIKTYITLGKMIENYKETYTLTTLNLMHIQNKMVLSNYIIKYENSNSINEIKQKNDYFVMSLLSGNE
jgi:hypothetical protein